MFSNFLGTKTSKCMQSILYGKRNKTLPKTCVFNAFSFLGTKTYVKHPAWRNRIALPNTYVSSVSQLVRIKTLKCLQSTLIWTTRRYYQKRVIWVFFTILGTKTLKKKHRKHYTWENKTLSKCVLIFFFF